MRIRKTALLVLALAVAAALVWIEWGRRPAPVPALSIEVVGYTNFSIPKLGEEPRGEWIRAEVRLKNEGSVTIRCHGWGTIPQSAVTAGPHGPLPFPVPGQVSMLIRPGQKVTFFEWLPKDRLRWKCGLSAQIPSARDRAFWKLVESPRITRHWGRAALWPLGFLPGKPGPIVELKGGWFEVGAASNGPPQSRPLQPAGTVPGR
jgi:hypothetical protein